MTVAGKKIEVGLSGLVTIRTGRAKPKIRDVNHDVGLTALESLVYSESR